MKARFITVEGVEGVGKSTNIAVLEKMLSDRGIDCVRTREPGGTDLAEKIRSMLLGDHGRRPAALSELLLIFAARADHLEKVIAPALEQGKWVICDRFTDATFAYQGGGRGLSREIIAALESMAQGELRPDLTIILDLNPEIGLERVRRRGEIDRIEREAIDFHVRVRDCYLDIARREAGRCAVIDASVEPDAVREALQAAVADKLPELR